MARVIIVLTLLINVVKFVIITLDLNKKAQLHIFASFSFCFRFFSMDTERVNNVSKLSILD